MTWFQGTWHWFRDVIETYIDKSPTLSYPLLGTPNLIPTGLTTLALNPGVYSYIWEWRSQWHHAPWLEPPPWLDTEIYNRSFREIQITQLQGEEPALSPSPPQKALWKVQAPRKMAFKKELKEPNKYIYGFSKFRPVEKHTVYKYLKGTSIIVRGSWRAPEETISQNVS